MGAGKGVSSSCHLFCVNYFTMAYKKGQKGLVIALRQEVTATVNNKTEAAALSKGPAAGHSQGRRQIRLGGRSNRNMADWGQKL